MKRNTYFIIVAVIALLEMILLWWGINNFRPPAMEILAIGISAGILIAVFLRSRIEDLPSAGDERLHLINEKSAVKTLQITWILLFSFAVTSMIMIIEKGDFFRKNFLGFPFIQMIILILALVVFAACRIYYTGKYGGFDSDEE